MYPKWLLRQHAAFWWFLSLVPRYSSLYHPVRAVFVLVGLVFGLVVGWALHQVPSGSLGLGISLCVGFSAYSLGAWAYYWTEKRFFGWGDHSLPWRKSGEFTPAIFDFTIRLVEALSWGIVLGFPLGLIFGL